MTTETKTIKVQLTNSFHGSSVNVVGELIVMGSDDRDPTTPAGGCAMVELSKSQVARAARILCGISECRCDRHGPSFDWDNRMETATVVGEIV